MRFLILTFALMCTLPARAAYDPTDPRPDMLILKFEIENGRAGDVITPLKDWLVTEPKDADALNLLGYAFRKLKRYTEAREFYDRALAVDPAHKGALEYLGELELETGHPDAARALLIRLQAVCPDGCHELEDLLEAFSTHGVSVLD